MTFLSKVYAKTEEQKKRVDQYKNNLQKYAEMHCYVG